MNNLLDLKSGDKQTDRQNEHQSTKNSPTRRRGEPNDRMTTKVLKTCPRVGAASPTTIV